MTRSRAGEPLALVLLATALVATSFFLQAFTDINLSDEGFLWYGAIAVSKGLVPMRDFQAYDPGRYYWTAPWMLVDRGIVTLRLACAAFHVPGILCGLLVLRRMTTSWWALAGGGALLTLWIFPPFMLNHTVALATVYVLVLLIEDPSVRRHFLAGLFTGLAAFFGRNLGLYALLALVVLVPVLGRRLDRRERLRRAGAGIAGIVAGYSPMLVMLAVVPGFWKVNLDYLRFLGAIGGTNLLRSVPWPWMAPTWWDASVGIFFVLLPAFYAASAAWLVAGGFDAWRERRILVAATLVGIPYLHYAFSRPDIEHLAMGVHPFALGVLALPFVVTRRRWLATTLVAAVAAVSLFAAGRVTSTWARLAAPEGWYVPTRLGRWTIALPRPVAAFIEGAIRFDTTMVQPGEGFFIAPHLGPGLYSILGRDSPVWQIYFIFPHPEWWQRELIEQFERNRVNWVLLEDVGTDWRDELRFRNTHRLLWEHIMAHFEPVPVDGLAPSWMLLRRRPGPAT